MPDHQPPTQTARTGQLDWLRTEAQAGGRGGGLGPGGKERAEATPSKPTASPHLPRIPPALPWPPQGARPALHMGLTVQANNKAHRTPV